MSGKEHWILDGYNVMHALNQIRPDLSFEISRERFISWVEPFQSLGDKKITIVFDDNVHAEGPHEIHPRSRIVYSPTGYNGDGTILSLIRNTQPKLRSKIIVVTRDLMLRDAILSLKSIVISPEAFLTEFERYTCHSFCLYQREEESHRAFFQPFRKFFDKN